MPRVVVDDTNTGRIKYSGGGQWDYWDEPPTLHSTYDWGAKATFAFRGTYVAVYGLIPQGYGEDIQVDFALDGGQADSEYRTAPRRTVYDELWWDSGTISGGDHTLVITFRGDQVDFQLDRIEYEEVAAINPPAAVAAPATSKTTIVATATSTQLVTETSTSQQLVTTTDATTASQSRSVQGTKVSGSGPATSMADEVRTSTETGTGASNQTVTATQFIMTSGGVVITITPSATSISAEGASSKTVPLGAIVGSVLGAVLLSLLILLFVLLRRRRRRQVPTSKYAFESAAEGSAPPRANKSTVTPFDISTKTSPDPLPVPPPLMYQRKGGLAAADWQGGEIYRSGSEGSSTTTTTIPRTSTLAPPSAANPWGEKSASIVFPNSGSNTLLSPCSTLAPDPPLSPATEATYAENDAGQAYYAGGRQEYASGDGSFAGPSRISSVLGVLPEVYDTLDLPPAYQSGRNGLTRPETTISTGTDLT